MMELLTQAQWLTYRNLLAKVSKQAVDEFLERSAKIAVKYGYARALDIPRNILVDLASDIVNKYGDAASEAACQLHDLIASIAKAKVPAAEPASVMELEEIAEVLNGAAKSDSEEVVAGAVGRMVKQAGQDTTYQNAKRDGAEYAWIPAGMTCAYCIMLAGNGWQKASKARVKDGHVRHIHENCDCAFAVRFSEDQTIGGYNPNKYKSMYQKADGTSAKDKLNSMRREFYAENKDRISAQKRDAYQKRKERESSQAEEADV